MGMAGRAGLGAAGRARRARRPAVAAPVLCQFQQGPLRTASVVATTARALVSSGLLSPPAPIGVLRVVREVYRGGTNLYTLLAVAAARWPKRTAMIDDDGAIPYRELQSKTESLARGLVRDGVGTGQAVCILCSNGRNFAAAAFAASLIG